MKHKVFGAPKNKVVEFFRAFAYAAFLSSITFLLIYLQLEGMMGWYQVFASIGILVVLLESFFIVNHVQGSKNSFLPTKRHKFWTHGVNHVFYPVVFFLGAVLYISIEENIVLSLGIAGITFFLFLLEYYYLPRHLLLGHIEDMNAKRASVRAEFILHTFKFFSYFIFHLGLFQALAQSRIGVEHIFISNILLTSLYFYSHLSRKLQVTRLNLFIATAFAAVNALFIVANISPIINYSTAIATLTFYLTSGIFYHKLEGTFTTPVFIEYFSIALILSIFIFGL